MIKCKYCGASLSLEDEKCPYCGRVNDQTGSYAEEKKKYKVDYKQTEQEVTNRSVYAHELKVRGVSLIILVGLFFALVLSGLIMDSKIRSWKQNKAVKEFDQISQNMEMYWDEEKYYEFYAYCDSKDITGWTADGPYLKYYPLMESAKCYEFINEHILNYFEVEKGYQKSEELETICGLLCNFYDRDYMSMYAKDVIDEKENDEKLSQIYESMGKILQTYFHLTKEEAKAFESMSENEMILCIEERMEDYHE